MKKLLAILTAVLMACPSAAFCAEAPAEEAETGSDVMILVTSDVHCGISDGFGYEGVAQIRQMLEAQGIATLLVDDGDSVQGETIGTLTQGEEIINLMNAMHYDVAIPGNHEFDYGMDQFMKLTEMAEFPYISCNFNLEGELVLKPYVIQEVSGLKIAFVGVTTPVTYTTSTPAYFQNEEGEFVYGFMQDETGEELYASVQKAVDDARAEGVDYVYVMAHLGLEAACQPWTYADVISHTNGIDVFLDGHSHDTEQVVMKNKDGEDVTRCAVGTKLNCLGYSRISPEEGIVETGIWSWPNQTAPGTLFGFQNEITEKVSEAEQVVSEKMDVVVASTAVELTINDPTEVDSSGNPIRMVRRAETNLGDLCADAVRDQSGADIGVVNGGGVRKVIAKGDITFGNILNVHPFGNLLTMIEATGQQILDALEWGSRSVPEECGGFLQVSGLSYEVDTTVENSCTTDENGMFTGVEGERRVKNVMVGEEPLDPEKTYTLAGNDYILRGHGDGFTMFDGAEVLLEEAKLDNQVLIDYITTTLGGEVGEEYSDPYGQGRITILE